MPDPVPARLRPAPTRTLRRRLMSYVLIASGLYVAILFALFLLQDRMVFSGARWGRGERLPSIPGVAVDRLALATGERFRVAIAEPVGPVRAAMVFFVGNGEDLRSGMAWAHEWAQDGLWALVVEYPGYGDSEGTPSKDSVLAAAEVAAQRVREEAERRGVRMVAGGVSLGTFSATHAAATCDAVERVFLLSPPTRIADVGRRRLFWLPIGLLLRHRFDNLASAQRVRCPAFVVHGDADGVVPHDMGQAVAAAFAGPAEFVSVPGAGHSRAPLIAHRQRILEFLLGD